MGMMIRISSLLNTKYLVKISAKLEKTMANYDEDDYEDFDDNDPEAIPDVEIAEEDEDNDDD
jgi:hypothetical protein